MAGADIIAENTRIAEKILIEIADMVKPGTSSHVLAEAAAALCRKYDILPSAIMMGTPHVISIAVNQEVLFGEIRPDKKICEGDVVSFAFGAFRNGFFTDLGWTICVGKGDSTAQNLIQGTMRAFLQAVTQVRAGVKVQSVSLAIERTLREAGLSPIANIMGHGVGHNLHELPPIPNSTSVPFIDYTYLLREHTVVCIEPIASTGSGAVVQKDHIQFCTADGSFSAHIELPVLVKKDGAEVLAPQLFERLQEME